LDPSIVYEVNRGVASHDYDLEAESWTYDGREVFRGSRDPSFSTVDLYWLYNEDAERIGLAEHDPRDHSKFFVGWFYECPFATWYQEDGWTMTEETLWSKMPSHVYEYCMEYGYTTAEKVAELCKRGPWRIMTPGSTDEIPDVTKVLFADSDCVLYTPPESSNCWKTATRVSEES
jgi:hypothetical protein